MSKKQKHIKTSFSNFDKAQAEKGFETLLKIVNKKMQKNYPGSEIILMRKRKKK